MSKRTNATSTESNAAKIYRATASHMEGLDGGLTCVRICKMQGLDFDSSNHLVKRFREAFQLGTNFWEASIVDHQERILALCFMAAMVEAGDA